MCISSKFVERTKSKISRTKVKVKSVIKSVSVVVVFISSKISNLYRNAIKYHKIKND